MYFNLKEPKSSEPTLIMLRYTISPQEGRFNYSTKLKIDPKNWDPQSKMPKNLRGNTKIAVIRKVLNQYSTLLDSTIDNKKINNEPILKSDLTKIFNIKFNRIDAVKTFKYFTDYVDDFIVRSPTLINKSTRKKYAAEKVRRYRLINRKIGQFEKYRNQRIRLNGFTQKVYDEFVTWCQDTQNYADNYTGDIIKNIKVLHKRAQYEDLKVCSDFEKSNFAVLKEETISIALTESEITKILNLDLSQNPYLSNTRDLAIIGFWTGLRVGDLMKLGTIKLDAKFIQVTPNKTKDSSGVKVVIPLHHQLKEVIEKRGMPHSISDVKFNKYIKKVCKKAGLNDLIKGSLKDPDTNRKKVALYPKYKLVSSHTCRRSFATNLYKMGFPSISIMQITGHRTEKAFLTYIKISPTEHAQRLLDHWEKYYN